MERRRPLGDVIAAALWPRAMEEHRGDKFKLLAKSSKGAAMPGETGRPSHP
ncbi:MAG TPA: hypothetical protein VFB63_33050 [Bryobacteraceae bacterium]|nr:hypothetical protein [Bryobacteraceae bacterium]